MAWRDLARPLRIQLAGGVYHVTSRSDGRDDIYLSDDDRDAGLVVFEQVCERFHWVCHAWEMLLIFMCGPRSWYRRDNRSEQES